MQPPAKRAKLGGRAAGDACTVCGDDDALSPAELNQWRDIVQQGQPWSDEAFPAVQLSISGKPEPAAAPTPSSGGATPRCACGVEAARATVRRDTGNKGRSYWHCAARRCGMFAWVDGAAWQKRKPLSWARMPRELQVVSDFGFRAADLRQGGVGDCWFMSALAVVAERHDLIAKLFAADTARNSSGCYSLRMFLDGRWKSVLIDDQLPVTAQPRRDHLAFDTKLAFCRTSGPNGEQQLWASLVEKAYAKAHGSYQAISGGQVAEALLDLTGAPTEMIYLGDDGFDSEMMWARLRAFRALQLPLGCGTNNAERGSDLREVGLFGGHAYSILDVREAETRGGQVVRLLRIRNPHGVGEWNGSWSDKSAEWSQLVSSSGEFERTGVDDGTFWQDYTHFLMGFSHVDVCFAFQGWHSQSFANRFPDKKSPQRCTEFVYFVTASEAPTTLLVMALQPTKRGSWCRSDRKKSYKLGDLSVLIVRLGPEGDTFEELVGGSFRGADRGERTFTAKISKPGRYAILPMCLGSSPSAAETTTHAPFWVRIWASEPIGVTPVSPATASVSYLALQAVHSSLLSDPTSAERCIPSGFGRAKELEKILLHPSNAALLVDGGLAQAGARIHRRVIKISPTIQATVACGSGLSLIQCFNMHETLTAHIQVQAFVKSNVARSSQGLLTNSKEDADSYYSKRVAMVSGKGKGKGGGNGFRWPAKWQCFKTECAVSPKSQRVCMVLAASGVQAEMGDVEISLCSPGNATTSKPQNASKASADSMRKWLDTGKGLSTGNASTCANLASVASAEGLFAELPLISQTAKKLEAANTRVAPSGMDDALETALIQSAAEHQNNQAAHDELQLALALQRSETEHKKTHEDEQMALALVRSAEEANSHRIVEDDDIAAAIAASLATPVRPAASTCTDTEERQLAAAIAESLVQQQVPVPEEKHIVVIDLMD